MEQDDAHNRKVHTSALSLTKLGDGLFDPKLVLAWLLTSLGASAGLIGLLVPIREAGALLPQLFTAAWLRHVSVRKWWWVIGSFVQAIAVFIITLSAIFLEGNLAGFVIIMALAVFALARSICSVSYKDVLGKTVLKPMRGLVTGTASSIAAAGVLLFGLLLSFAVFERSSLVLVALFIASLGWLLAGIVFSFLQESPSEILVDRSENVFKTYWKYLTSDKELQKFLWVRGLLSATAIAPPFLLLLAAESKGGLLAQLGSLVIAAALAAMLSGRIWGRLSDTSTRYVLVLSGSASTIALLAAIAAAGTNMYATSWFLPLLLFFFMLSYQGVRIARTIHLVNLASEETRAAYTAISNTVIGIVLLGTGIFGVLAEIFSVLTVIVILAAMSLLGSVLAQILEEV